MGRGFGVLVLYKWGLVEIRLGYGVLVKLFGRDVELVGYYCVINIFRFDVV